MKKVQRVFCVMTFVFALLVYEGNDRAWGAFVKRHVADEVAISWILKDSNPMKDGMGHKVRETLVYRGGAHGYPGYYVALMDPAGWMVIPADDAFEPVLAFGNDFMTREIFERSPLFHLVRVDAPRLDQMTTSSRSVGVQDIPEIKRRERKSRWYYLSTVNCGLFGKMIRESGYREDFMERDLLSDVVVSPILEGNRWEQNTLKQYNNNVWTKNEVSFYDTYTVWGGHHYLVGCTALCAGKLLHHFRFGQPDTKTAVGIEVDGQSIEVTPMGGTGADGAYRWDIMVTSPDYDVWKPRLEDQDPEALAARNEIARLLYDCGVLLGSHYIWDNSRDRPLVTIAKVKNFDSMLTQLGYRADTFPYTAFPFFTSQDQGFDPFSTLAKTNLNFDMPFVVYGTIRSGLSSDDIGHAFIVDGYGNDFYSDEGGKTSYYHAKWDLNHSKFFQSINNLWFDLSRDSVK